MHAQSSLTVSVNSSLQCHNGSLFGAVQSLSDLIRDLEDRADGRLSWLDEHADGPPAGRTTPKGLSSRSHSQHVCDSQKKRNGRGRYEKNCRQAGYISGKIEVAVGQSGAQTRALEVRAVARIGTLEAVACLGKRREEWEAGGGRDDGLALQGSAGPSSGAVANTSPGRIITSLRAPQSTLQLLQHRPPAAFGQCWTHCRCGEK